MLKSDQAQQLNELAVAAHGIQVTDPFAKQLIAVLQNLHGAIEDVRNQLSRRVKDYFSVEEVADLTDRKPYTVRRWIKEGRITATRVAGTGPKGKLLIARSEVAKLVTAGMMTGAVDFITEDGASELCGQT